MKRLSLFALLLLTAPLFAAGPIEMPAEVKVPITGAGRVGVVNIKAKSDQIRFLFTGPPIISIREYDPDLTNIRLRVQSDDACTADLVVAAIVDGKIEFEKCHLIFGDPPPPVPPGPNPPVPPTPVVEGKRAIIIVRETKDGTPAMKSLIINLRTGAVDEYFRSKGHLCRVLDKDSVGPDGTPAFEAWRPAFKDMTLPAVLIVEPTTRAVVGKESLSPTATADDVLRILKANGG